MNAKRMRKPMPKLARSGALRRCSAQTAKGERAGPPEAIVNQQGAAQVEDREDVEVGGEPEMIGERGREQPAEEVAGDVAGDVRRRRARRLAGAALLGEIGERQREGR